MMSMSVFGGNANLRGEMRLIGQHAQRIKAIDRAVTIDRLDFPVLLLISYIHAIKT